MKVINVGSWKKNYQKQSSFNLKSLCSSRKENEGGKRASFLSCLFGSSKVKSQGNPEQKSNLKIL